MAESKNFYLQNGAGSETISQRESRVIMVWEGYRSRHHKCNDLNVHGLFGRDSAAVGLSRRFNAITSQSPSGRII